MTKNTSQAEGEGDYQEQTETIVEEARNDEGPIIEHTGKEAQPAPTGVVWTPRFIVLFFLTAVLGLSIESLLTQGLLNGFYRAEWVTLVQVVLVLIGLIVLIRQGKSQWIRAGAVIGCIWAVLTGMSYVAVLLGIGGRSGILAQFHATMACALLGTYICFSTHRIPFRRWDSLFFWLAPPGGGIAVLVLYSIARAEPHHIRVLVDAATTVLLSLCVSIWWLRPSCWRSQPCVTFLLGIAPLLLLLLPRVPTDNNGTPLFLAQVLLLCTLLGVMRVLQGELQQA